MSTALLPLGDLPYADQLAAHRAAVERALQGVPLAAPVAATVPSPRERGARARITLRSGPRGELGFHLPRTHTFVEIDLHLLARPEVVAAAHGLTEALGGRKLHGGVEIRSDGERVALHFEQAPPRPIEGNVAVAGRPKGGDPTLHPAGLRASPASFFQVNLEVNAAIVARVEGWLARLAPAHVLDLYAGIGNLSVGAHRRGVPVTLLESEPAAVRDASHNLRGAKVEKGDAGRYRAGQHFFDVALLDPPRAGAPGVLEQLAVTRPRAILYLSCDPVSLARDLRTVVGRGYHLVEVTPFDMFPGSQHVETLAVLERADRR